MKTFSFLLSIILIFTLTGCSSLNDYTESDETALISALGFKMKDKSLTLFAETVSKNDTDEKIILTVSGENVKDCITALKKKAGLKIILSHCGAVALCTDIAKEDIKEILAFLAESYDIPLGSYIIYGDPESLFKAKGLKERQIGYEIITVCRKTDKDSRLFKVMRSNNFSFPTFTVSGEICMLKDGLWTVQ